MQCSVMMFMALSDCAEREIEPQVKICEWRSDRFNKTPEVSGLDHFSCIEIIYLMIFG